MSVLTPTPQKTISPDTNTPRPVSAGLTLRAVFAGCLFTILLTLWALHSEFITKSSPITVTHLPVAALCPFVIMTLFINPILKKTGFWRPFSAEELIVIFFLVFTASAIPGWAFSNYALSIISGPFYFATAENRWAELFLQYLPSWLVLQDNPRALAAFYEGVPAGQPIPWEIWFVPLFWWITLYGAIFMVGASMMVILRKQWVEHERLSFPLAQVPLMLVEGTADRQALPRIARTPLFWWGFGVTLFIMVWNIIAFFDVVTPIPIGPAHGTPLTLYESFPPIHLRFNFLLLGVAYFTRIEVLASVWLFYLIRIIEQGILTRVGMPQAAVTIHFQHISGFLIFAGFSIWMARKHLSDVIKKALGKAPHIDDSREFFSYRTAVIGFLVGFLYMTFWLLAAGMSFWIICFLLGLLFLLYLGVTRVVAETGLASLDLPYNSANEIATFYIGTEHIPPPSLTLMWLSETFTRNWRTLGMCSMAHAAKVGDTMGGVGRGVFGAIVGALMLSFATAVVYTLYQGYDIGASQITGSFISGANGYWAQLGAYLTNPQGLTAEQYFYAAVGAVISIILIWGYHHIPAWPLHPVGFGVVTTFAADMAFFSIFTIWLVKSLIMRFGGVTLYRTAQPFFIGILCGYTIGVLLSFAADYFWFPGAGHVVDDW
jgi:hypothetical protein